MRRRVLSPILLAGLLLSLASSPGCAPRRATSPPPVVDAPAASLTATPVVDAPAAPPAATPATDATVTFAVIGDYGVHDAHERAVARSVASWDPSFVITTGDGYYSPAGGTGTGKYDRSTGAYYCRWLKGISTTGKSCAIGNAAVNAFFPCLGNHDYSDATPSPSTYLKYFRLPGAGLKNTSGNERYYDFVRGPVHFFVLNSNSAEPAGTSAKSVQGRWLRTRLAASTSRWNVVYEHHPPYSSDSVHGSSGYMRWPFASWGADIVFSGHSHTYERVMRDGIAYFVNGLGGAARYGFTTPVKGSAARYRSDWGAQKVTVTGKTLDVRFYNVRGKLVDRYTASH